MSRWHALWYDIRRGLAALALLAVLDGAFAQTPATTTPAAPTEAALQAALHEAELRQGADSAGTLEPLVALQDFYTDAGRLPEALPLAQRALRIAERVHGPADPRLAAPLNSLGELLRQLGQPAQALPLHRRSLALQEQQLGPDHVEVAALLGNLALDEMALGRFPEALALLQRSLAIRERQLGPDHLDVANSLNSLAELYRQAGPQAQAVPLYERTLAIIEKQLGPEHPLAALVLGNLAAAQLQVGRLDKALPAAQRSLAIRTKLLGPDHPQTAAGVSMLAEVNRALGQDAASLALLERALRTYERTLGPDHPEVARALNNLAGLLDHLGRPAEAVPLYERSLAIIERQFGPEHPLVANPLNNLASLHQERGRADLALPLHRRALALRERTLGPEHPEVAISRHNLALALAASGEREAAFEELQRAIAIAAPNPAGRDVLWASQSDLARLHAAAGRTELAILWGKEAVNTLQGLRSDLVSLERELQRDYLRDKRAAYDRLADLLIQQGRIAEAQEVLQMLKEQELHDGLERAGSTDPRSTRIELTGLERERFADYYALRDRQAALAAEREALERRRAAGPLSAADAARLQEIVERLMPVAAAAMQRFFGQLEREMAAAPEPGRPAAGVEASRLRRAVDELAASEPAARAVGVQYLVTGERLSIVLSLPGSPPIAVQQRVSRSALYRRLNEVLLQVSHPRSDAALLRPALRELHGWLVEPIAADLQRFGARTLMLSLDDQLRLIPFAALLDARGRYLVQDYTLALYNEAARQALEKPSAPRWRVAAMGLSEAVDDLPALAAVPDELAAVVRGKGLTGDTWLNGAFDRTRLAATLRGVRGDNVLHVASHFVLEPGRPARSRLYLGDKTRLTLADITREDLQFGRFDLVTFSACETARGGGRDATGQEMESLSAKTQNQGAQAVLATLWKVDDASTGTFMQRFYAGRGEQGLNKAEALRAVQIAMIEGRLRSRGNRDWRAPFHWAPFVLMGNWR
ncbi:MAG: tetratricopeptide repeat protein [Piscinibacter sp.]|nr:tetratricopeptide repeat protein [Piscinibacter sp.]